MDIRNDNNPGPPLFTLTDLPPNLLPKLQPLITLLNSPEIDTQHLKSLLSTGIPDEAPLLREYAWKLSLGFLPRSKCRWQAQ